MRSISCIPSDNLAGDALRHLPILYNSQIYLIGWIRPLKMVAQFLGKRY